MASLEQNRVAFAATKAGGEQYSVRRSIAIIAGLSLGFWGLLGFIVYKMF